MKTVEKVLKLNEPFQKAKQAREKKKTEKNQIPEGIYYFTFGLYKKVLSFPRFSTFIPYYKLNLYVCNFVMHSVYNSVGYMHVRN